MRNNSQEPNQVIRFYSRFTRFKKSTFFLLLILGKCIITFELITPVFSKVLFDYVFPKRDITVLNLLILSWATLVCMGFFLKSGLGLLLLHTNQTIAHRIRTAVFARLQNLRLNFLRNSSRGDLIVRLTDDVDRSLDVLVTWKLDLFSQITQIAAIMCVCFWINLHAALFVMASLFVYIFIPKYLFKREIGNIRDLMRLQKSETIDYLESELRQISVVKTFRQQTTEQMRFDGLIRNQIGATFRERLITLISTMNTELGFDLWSLVITWYLSYDVVRNNLTIGDTISLLLLFQQVRGPASALSRQFGRYRSSLASLQRVHEFARLSKENATENESTESHKQGILEGKIEFKDVHFGYDLKSPVFSGLELTIPPRAFVAIVGENGSGKSSLVQLLTRFHEPNRGKILIDGTDYTHLPLHNIRQWIIDVTHDHGIFPGTIRENITYGKHNASDAEVETAARNAAIWEFIQRQPLGLNTVIRNEDHLSLGHRQRLAIARALLVDPKILILDEVTTALDAITEFSLQDSMRRLALSKTIIMIAHRPSTLRNADRILFLKNGRITEEGQFDELLEKRGDFFSYYSSQFGGFAEFLRILDHEMYRCARHGSRFTVHSFRMLNYEEIAPQLSSTALPKLLSTIELAWVKTIRRGDTAAAFRKGYFLVLSPELDAQNLSQFHTRMYQQMNQRSFVIDDREIKPVFGHRSVAYADPKSLPKSGEELIRLLTEDDHAEPRKAA